MLDSLLTYGWMGLIVAFWFALCVGSFLNVVIYRLPVMLNRQWQAEARALLEDGDPEAPVAQETFNLATPRSRCPSCGARIRAWQNIPVISWLLLRGRCSHCGAPISARYPAVELFTGIATLVVLHVYGFTWLGLAAALFTWVLIAATFIDFDTQLLPDQLTLPLLWLGIIVNMSDGFGAGAIVDLNAALVGAMAGYLFLWTTYWGFKLITGKEGMGYGDFKLLAAIGAWMGWQIIPGTILIAAGTGLVYAAIITVLGRRARAQPIAFGPFLAIAGWVCLVNRDTVLSFFAA
ncbi:MAG: A24 family peptidase [Pseudomonadales bacterium]|jgi:leader peptidase (prepilin peptidase)/N-methyltransferase